MSPKIIRGQLRQIALELLPDLIKSSLFDELKKQIAAQLSDRLDIIDARQKDIQGYIVRQSSPVAPDLTKKLQD